MLPMSLNFYYENSVGSAAATMFAGDDAYYTFLSRKHSTFYLS